ncbi:M1 family metallopeptidase [Jiulongibacter sediminis]|uniref:M1 family metallopeptidase n=1 Tax=Jiulongibacter sediminis TaxID=1605367 RepID=UPI000AA6589E|nr:M1 family metallopeptidase [Jiulongibacter sediminis]
MTRTFFWAVENKSTANRKGVYPKIIALLSLLPVFTSFIATAQLQSNRVFEQLGTELPTPNTYRTGSGAPGRDYFQQKADYSIKVELDDVNQRIIGEEVVTYYNYSPDPLSYIWVQLDMNMFKDNSINALSKTGGIDEKMTSGQLSGLQSANSVYGDVDNSRERGYDIKYVKNMAGRDLKHTINSTMMRIDLPEPLTTNQSVQFQIAWSYNMADYYGRSGYEYFEEDGNYNYFVAHWFPRMCVYDDVNGWQNKQFVGNGEFALVFGDYEVEITVPDDHVVVATGECQNWDKVLTRTQKKRLDEASKATDPVLIVTQEEAIENSKTKSDKKQTWKYKASNVRDFAFASSRRFIWDAMQTDVYGNGRKIWSMSVYPKEGNPLWGQYSTKVVEHTLKTYGKSTIEYPYPVAISCHATPRGGMEYPMISFNGGRPEADGTYSENVKRGMIGVIIHEVGHNFFPMIINSDERQWTWMDEGLNSFCQYLSEQEWSRDFPSRRGEPKNIVSYMRSDPSQMQPIMTNSEQVIQFGNNAYGKPATALNILRETVMGRELFDYAFKEYAKRWAFKHPKPADFFRTMEDASGVDLDWFWRGWFYTTEAVDQDLAEVEWFSLDTQNPEIVKAEGRAEHEKDTETIANIRNRTDIPQTVEEADEKYRDFYSSYDPYEVTPQDKQRYEAYLKTLSEDERKLVESGMNYYALKVKNKGGLVMPLIVKMEFEDGTEEVVRFPAEIWRKNNIEITKTIPTKKRVKKFVLDPYQEIADIDDSNNAFPREPEKPTRFQLYKSSSRASTNPMQEARQNGAAATQGAD